MRFILKTEVNERRYNPCPITSNSRQVKPLTSAKRAGETHPVKRGF